MGLTWALRQQEDSGRGRWPTHAIGFFGGAPLPLPDTCRSSGTPFDPLELELLPLPVGIAEKKIKELIRSRIIFQNDKTIIYNSYC